MGEQQLRLPSAGRITDRLFPGSKLISAELLPGSYANLTHVFVLRTRQGQEKRLVVRRYRVSGRYDRSEKAVREYRALQLLKHHGIPAPEGLLLDPEGALLEIPGIVTAFVPGEMATDPAAIHLAHAEEMARMLARIHTVPGDPGKHPDLLDGNAEASWFNRSEYIPDYLQRHPYGKQLWQAFRAGLPALQPHPDRLLHLDYWPGNLLWQAGRISAVVDWEEAAHGDPAIDVAYARMEFSILDRADAADRFLEIYISASGNPLPNLALWELAAAVRPICSPDVWFSYPEQHTHLGRFIARTLAKIT